MGDQFDGESQNGLRRVRGVLSDRKELREYGLAVRAIAHRLGALRSEAKEVVRADCASGKIVDRNDLLSAQRLSIEDASDEAW